MGTFHDNLGDLHGITVLVETTSDVVFVGRCHEQNASEIVILDAADHDPTESDQTRTDWLKQATQWGVFPKHKVLRLPVTTVQKVTPLGQVKL